MDEKDHIQGSLVFIISQTLQYGMSSIFYFASYLAEEIHNGFIGIRKGKVDMPFFSYSFLMYMCLYKGVSIFAKDMKLELEKDGEKLLVQLWSVDMTWEVTDASFIHLNMYFSSKMRIFLTRDNLQIHQPLLELIRPKDHAKGLKFSHNQEEIIPYSISTIFKVYDFQGKPHVFPYQVPLKLGVSKFLWQVGGLEERELVGRSRGTFFPNFTVIHNFVLTKGGQRHLGKFLEKYQMAQSHSCFIDSKGFYDMLKERTKAKSYEQIVYFPKDIIRNQFSLQENEVKKEKWKVYIWVLEFFNALDRKYDPIADIKYQGDKINNLMAHFLGIMQTLNEKKEILIKAYPDQARKVEKRMTNKIIISLGKYTLQRKEGYVVARNVGAQPIPMYKRKISESPPSKPVAKIKKLE